MLSLCSFLGLVWEIRLNNLEAELIRPDHKLMALTSSFLANMFALSTDAAGSDGVGATRQYGVAKWDFHRGELKVDAPSQDLLVTQLTLLNALCRPRLSKHPAGTPFPGLSGQDRLTRRVPSPPAPPPGAARPG